MKTLTIVQLRKLLPGINMEKQKRKGTYSLSNENGSIGTITFKNNLIIDIQFHQLNYSNECIIECLNAYNLIDSNVKGWIGCHKILNRSELLATCRIDEHMDSVEEATERKETLLKNIERYEAKIKKEEIKLERVIEANYPELIATHEEEIKRLSNRKEVMEEEIEAITRALTSVEEQEETNTKENNNMKESKKEMDKLMHGLLDQVFSEEEARETARIIKLANSMTLEQAQKEKDFYSNEVIKKANAKKSTSKDLNKMLDAKAVIELKEKEAAAATHALTSVEEQEETNTIKHEEEYNLLIEEIKELKNNLNVEGIEVFTTNQIKNLEELKEEVYRNYRYTPDGGMPLDTFLSRLNLTVKEEVKGTIEDLRARLIKKIEEVNPLEYVRRMEATPHALTPAEIVEEQEESQQPTTTPAPYNGNERAAKVIKIVTGKDVDVSAMTFGDFLSMMEEEEEEEEVQAVEVETVEAVEVAHTLEAQLENLKRVFTIEKKKIMASKEIAQLEDEKYQMAETAKLYVGFATNERRRKNTRGAHTCNNTARRYEDKANNIQKKIELLESDNITLL